MSHRYEKLAIDLKWDGGIVLQSFQNEKFIPDVYLKFQSDYLLKTRAIIEMLVLDGDSQTQLG